MSVLGKFNNIYSNVIKAREMQAQKSVHAYFAQFDDATLNRLGVKRENLKKGGTISYFW